MPSVHVRIGGDTTSRNLSFEIPTHVPQVAKHRSFSACVFSFFDGTQPPMQKPNGTNIVLTCLFSCQTHHQRRDPFRTIPGDDHVSTLLFPRPSRLRQCARRGRASGSVYGVLFGGGFPHLGGRQHRAVRLGVGRKDGRRGPIGRADGFEGAPSPGGAADHEGLGGVGVIICVRLCPFFRFDFPCVPRCFFFF